jgi:histone H2A
MVSKQQAAGLCFSISRLDKKLRNEGYADRLSQCASVFLAGVLEYLVGEILEIGGEYAHSSKKLR